MASHRWTVFLALFAFSLPVGSANSTLPPGAVLLEVANWTAPTAQARRDADAVLAQVAGARPDAAIALMQGWQDPVRFEFAASLVIPDLQSRPESNASRALLSALSIEPVRVFRRHEETAADWFLPMFDIGERASSALKLFDFLSAREALAISLSHDPVAALAASPAESIVAAAIASVDAPALERIAALAMSDRIALASSGWTALARRRPSPEVLTKAVENAQPLDVLPLIAHLVETLTPDDATVFLERTSQAPELASAAILALGRVAAKHAPAETALEAHLGDPATGASAASALARLERDDRVERIDRLLARAKHPAAVRDLALALRLEGSTAARERLERLRDDPRLPASAKSELLP